MKWFKHETAKSESLSILMAQFGMEGKGMWYTLLEIVASKIDGTDRCHLELPEKDWCYLLQVKRKKLRLFLEQTEKLLKTRVVYSKNVIRIEIPNLLKKRDNHTKHLEAEEKKLDSNLPLEGDKEVYNKDKDVEGEDPTPLFVISLKDKYPHLDVEKVFIKYKSHRDRKGWGVSEESFIKWLDNEWGNKKPTNESSKPPPIKEFEPLTDKDVKKGKGSLKEILEKYKTDS